MRPLLEPWRAKCFAVCAALAPCFVRRFQGDGALFVCDLPRRGAPGLVSEALAGLTGLGFVCVTPASRGLLLLDASPARYEALLEPLPLSPPPLPAREELHPAYALCRLLLAHPAPFAPQPLGPLRQMLKWMDTLPPGPFLREVAGLHEQCAGLLREHRPLPHGAGRLLAAWLFEQSGAL